MSIRTAFLILAAASVLTSIGCSKPASTTPAVSGDPGPKAALDPSKNPATAMAMPVVKIDAAVKDGVFVDKKTGKPVCPVLGTPVTPKTAYASTTYKGVKYYFCCGSCPGDFAMHKDKYAYHGPTKPASKSTKV